MRTNFTSLCGHVFKDNNVLSWHLFVYVDINFFMLTINLFLVGQIWICMLTNLKFYMYKFEFGCVRIISSMYIIIIRWLSIALLIPATL